MAGCTISALSHQFTLNKAAQILLVCHYICCKFSLFVTHYNIWPVPHTIISVTPGPATLLFLSTEVS